MHSVIGQVQISWDCIALGIRAPKLGTHTIYFTLPDNISTIYYSFFHLFLDTSYQLLDTLSLLKTVGPLR